MEWGNANAIFAAILQFGVVVILARYLWMYRLRMPWLAVLFLYFTLAEVRSVVYIVRRWDEDRPPLTSMDVAMSLMMFALLVALMVTSGRMLAGIQAMQDAAAFRQQEYARALRHYNQLVRHRIFNPLAVISGAAVTLRAGRTDETSEEQLLDAIIDAAEVIKHTTLEPEQQAAEESSLDAVPHDSRFSRRSAATQSVRRPHEPSEARS